MIINNRQDIPVLPPDKAVFSAKSRRYIIAQGYVVNSYVYPRNPPTPGSSPVYAYDMVTRKSVFTGEPFVTVWPARDNTSRLFYKRHDTGETFTVNIFSHLCERGIFDYGIFPGVDGSVPRGTDPYAELTVDKTALYRIVRSPIMITNDTDLKLFFFTREGNTIYAVGRSIRSPFAPLLSSNQQTPFGFIGGAFGSVFGDLSISYTASEYTRGRITDEWVHVSTRQYNHTIKLPHNVYNDSGYIHDDPANNDVTMTPEPNLFMFDKRYVVRTAPSTLTASYIEFANLAEYQAAVNIVVSRTLPNGLPCSY